jgi:hypothetical protein
LSDIDPNAILNRENVEKEAESEPTVPGATVANTEHHFVKVRPGALSPAPVGANTNLLASVWVIFPINGGPSCWNRAS